MKITCLEAKIFKSQLIGTEHLLLSILRDEDNIGTQILDKFDVAYDVVKELLEYQIYNRWGELIFETNDIEQGWDGKYKGEYQNNDIYVYKVRVLTWRDEEKALEGYIQLIR